MLLKRRVTITDGMCVSWAARILRRDMFKDFPKFSGSLNEGFGPRDCVPPSLVNFLSTVLGGHNIDSGSPASFAEQTAAFSIAQLIRFNCVNRQHTNRSEHTRHHVDRETPLPIYLALMLHSRTRKKSLVDKISHLGLCVSYDRVQQIESTVTSTVCDAYNSLEHVLPVNLSTHVFTTAAIDSIDYNPTSPVVHSIYNNKTSTLIVMTSRLLSNSFNGIRLCQYLGIILVGSLAVPLSRISLVEPWTLCSVRS